MTRIYLVAIFLFCSLIDPTFPAARAEFYGDFPTGLLELEKKHPYYVFVPPDYSPDRVWSLILLIGRSGQDPKEVITPWLDWAKQNHFLLLVPSIFPREGTVTYDLDRWLFGLKQEVAERYRVNPTQILLVGFESGALYAAYLGTRYPKEFSAAALVGEARPGWFKKIAEPSTDPYKQISFYLAPDPEGKGFSEAEAWALELEKKGYRVIFEPMKTGGDFSKLRERVVQWFQEDSKVRSALKKKPRTKWRDKTRGFLKDFFEV